MLTIGTIKRTFSAILEASSSSALLDDQTLITQFLSDLDNLNYSETDELDEALLYELADLYEVRWQRIKGTYLDYTRGVDGPNRPWYSLAQLLLEEGYLLEAPDEQGMLFIQFLMPTVCNHQCDVSLDYLSDLPLTECILSEDEKRLIPLRPIFALFENNKVFSYISKGPATPLTAIELSRIEHAYSLDEHGEKNYWFWQQYQQQVKPFLDKKEPSLQLSTLYKVKELVEETCIEKGFYSDYAQIDDDNYIVIDEEENTQTEKAYLNFIQFLNQLGSEEKEVLFSQRIAYNYQTVTFGEMWSHAFDGVTCTSLNALYFMKLVHDYLPHLSYSADHLTKAQQSLGPSKHKKVQLPGFSLDEEICNERCLILMSYLLTHSFKVAFGTGATILLEDDSSTPSQLLQNTVPKTAEQMFNALKDALFIHHNWQFALYDILENIVKPELAREVPYARYPETQQWLQSLLDESFWRTERSAQCTDISELLKQLCQTQKLSEESRVVQRSYITQLISISSNLKLKPNCIESNRKLLQLCREVKSFLDGLSKDKLEHGSGDKVLQIIKGIAVENLLTQLACKQVSKQSFFGKKHSSRVDELTLLQLKLEIKQDLELQGFLTIQQALLAVFNKIRASEEACKRYNIGQAQNWLSNLGFYTEEVILEPAEYCPPPIPVGGPN